jgi:TRAP-type transport system periplasmic protein
MDPMHLKFGGYQSPASIHNRAAQYFGNLLKAQLGREFQFELAGNVLELGRGSGDLPGMVERGEIDFCYISTVRFSRPVPELQLLELPFIVKDRASVIAALNGELGALLARRMLENTPFRVLGFWDNGFRHISSVRPIRSPYDCWGLRIRTQMSDLHVQTFRALDFEPLAVDVKEFVDQIATGRFQAQDNPLTNIYNFGVHHYHRYITLTGHFFGASFLMCSEARHREWPPKVQAAVELAAREATAYQHRLAAAEDAEILAKLDPRHNEVIRLTDAQHAAFVNKVRPVLEKYRGILGGELFAYLEPGRAA